jgi:hypothetical protein
MHHGFPPLEVTFIGGHPEVFPKSPAQLVLMDFAEVQGKRAHFHQEQIGLETAERALQS